MAAYFSFLSDVDTGRIFAVSDEPSVINLLASVDGSILNNVLYDSGVEKPELTPLHFLKNVPPEKWLEYRLRNSKLSHSPDSPPITPELVSKSELLKAKRIALGRVGVALSISRRKLQMPAFYCDTIRSIKSAQALKFREIGYDESDLQPYIYVWQYAEVHRIAPREAADRIILENEFFETELWKAEGTKMKYWNTILEMKSPNELENIMIDFTREFYVNSKV